MKGSIDIIECPRDAMQGITDWIPTEMKTEYINLLLKAGFHTIDFGSFVSPKAVPQMADSGEVLKGLDISSTNTRLLAIVVNNRGVEEALKYEEIHYLGYPFSISETFQLRNTNRDIATSWTLVKNMFEEVEKNGKELVIYLSMAFGNPYGDSWSVDLVEEWTGKMVELGVRTVSLADTVGSASSEHIENLFGKLIPAYPDTVIGAHFHSSPEGRREKINAAFQQGCRRFDVAMQGFGGCPFAKDDLVGNIATESLLSFCEERGIESGIKKDLLVEIAKIANKIFH